MSDSSDESINIEIPYSKRPEWSDIKPIDQDEKTNEICRIAYTETFKEVFGYLRAVLKLNEKSDRALELTQDAALLNPANYTVWYYRRVLLKELKKDLNDELDFITNVIKSNPKNYQVWQHRRNIVELLQDPSNELEFTESILKRDSKNYHAWQYRQWVIKTFGLWQKELDYVNDLIEIDIRNNSAWNQRYFYHSNLDKVSSESDLLEEIEYCMNKINICVDNESCWNYLRALIKHLLELKQACQYPDNLIEFLNVKLNTDKEDEKSPYLIAFMFDYNCKKLKEMNKTEENFTKTLNETFNYLDLLANKYDTIRSNYWNYLKSKLKSEFS